MHPRERRGLKPLGVCLPRSAPPSAAGSGWGSTHDQLTAKQPVSEAVSDVGGGRPEMKPYQPIPGFMSSNVYVSCSCCGPTGLPQKGQAPKLFFNFFARFVPAYDAMLGTRAEKGTPYNDAGAYTLPGLDPGPPPRRISLPPSPRAGPTSNSWLL